MSRDSGIRIGTSRVRMGISVCWKRAESKAQSKGFGPRSSHALSISRESFSVLTIFLMTFFLLFLGLEYKEMAVVLLTRHSVLLGPVH